VQVPVYEYLAALGTLLAAALGLRWWLWSRPENERPALNELVDANDISGDPPALTAKGIRVRALAFIGFWTITSILAYTLAGEKMPWLTVHIALPMLLLSGWALGYLIKKVRWEDFSQQRGLLAVILLPVLAISLASVISGLLGPNPPFQGPELPQLQATTSFLLSLIAAAASGWGLNSLLKGWQRSQTLAVITLSVFGLLGLMTVKTAVTAAYIRYDEATEYLVYAHSARGVKDVMERIEDISARTTDGLGIEVGFDDDVSWPFTWYLRNYYNQRYYHDNPTRDLRNAPVIVVGDNNFSKIEPIVGQAYYRFDYIRMVWPNQDYFDLSRMRERLFSPETGPLMRAALFNIWLDRDYGLYSQVTSADFALSNWSPSDRMRLYIRKDVAATLWEYGVGPSPEEVVADPYEGKEIELAADRAFGGPGLLDGPRDIAVAPDGSIYVADSRNHRIQRFDASGELIDEWGSQPAIQRGTNAEGFFNEPWGIAVSPDGEFVYVADTWNHRIQKFTAEGRFLDQWGAFGQDPANPEAYWGPRGIAVDNDGNVLLTDTGNKRVVVFDANGNFLTQFGGQGFGLGEFDEPVGIAVDPDTNNVFVADTWNQRVQVFSRDASGNYLPLNSWDIFGWFGQSLENKPYLEAAPGGRLFIVDPEAGRILEYRTDGEFVQYWVAFNAAGSVTQPIGIGIDPRGGLWFSDGAGNQIVHYPLP
jgi:DNA-binding beta-propeller fold protein YncE